MLRGWPPFLERAAQVLRGLHPTPWAVPTPASRSSSCSTLCHPQSGADAQGGAPHPLGLVLTAGACVGDRVSHADPTALGGLHPPLCSPQSKASSTREVGTHAPRLWGCALPARTHGKLILPRRRGNDVIVLTVWDGTAACLRGDLLQYLRAARTPWGSFDTHCGEQTKTKSKTPNASPFPRDLSYGPSPAGHAAQGPGAAVALVLSQHVPSQTFPGCP